jgi:hypothetical protein
MTIQRSSVTLALTLLARALGNARVVHAHDVDTGVARLGEVRFPVSCNVAAQKEF